MKKTEQNTNERYLQIIAWIPVIKEIIKLGGEWKELEAICFPLGLNDTAFRDNPTIDDICLDIKWYRKQIKMICNVCKGKGFYYCERREQDVFCRYCDKGRRMRKDAADN